MPMLRPDQVLLFADDNRRRSSDGSSTNEESKRSDWRRWWLTRRAPRVVSSRGGLDALSASWSTSMWTSWITSTCPSPRNTRRNVGLRFTQLVAALRELVAAPNWVALTICEVNPDHGELDGSTLRVFNEGLADVLSEAMGRTTNHR